MNKVNTYCGGVSVSHKTTIAVQMDLVFDTVKMQCELNRRLELKAKSEKLSVNPHHFAVCEVERHPTSVKVLLVTYPFSLPNVKEIILEVLGEIEADVKAVVKADRLRGLLAERVVAG